MTARDRERRFASVDVFWIQTDGIIVGFKVENLNDAMAQLQAEANQKQLNASPNPIGFVVRNNE